MRTFNVALTPAARRELDEITDTLAEEAGVAIAIRWSRRIRDQIRDLRTLPFRGISDERLRPHRRLVLAPYVILYRVAEPDNVFVIRILDGRRDLPALLQSNDEHEIDL